MLNRWFLAHPRSVDESYLEHQAHALRFSGSLFLAAGACFIHALVPGLFERTGSRTIERLHDEMVVHRKRNEARPRREPFSPPRSVALGRVQTPPPNPKDHRRAPTRALDGWPDRARAIRQARRADADQSRIAMGLPAKVDSPQRCLMNGLFTGRHGHLEGA